jgi:hypothetical protein
MKREWILVAIGSALATACATTPIPADKLARSAAALKSAEVANVQDVPQAEMHLRLAHQEMDQGRKLIARGENELAGYALLRSEADAEAALNLTREADAKGDAAQTLQMVQTMKAKMEVPK